ncbi:MAG: hypothetical protein HKN22_01215 [Bacteroidia bacterium]|nr:hypothetical protein [Bacteroidia bacterium]
MKKFILLTAAIIFTYGYSNAQFSQGTICLSGVIDFQSTGGETTTAGVSTDNPKTSVIGFIPKGLYFLNPNLAVGLGIGYTSTKTTTVAAGFSETEATTSLVSFLPCARYLLVGNERAGISGMFVIDYSTGKTETTTSFVSGAPSTTAETDISAFGLAVAPHFYLFLTDRIAIESTFGHLGYGSVKTETGTGAAATETTNTAFSLNLNPLNSLTFGVAFYFGGSE